MESGTAAGVLAGLGRRRLLNLDRLRVWAENARIEDRGRRVRGMACARV